MALCCGAVPEPAKLVPTPALHAAARDAGTRVLRAGADPGDACQRAAACADTAVPCTGRTDRHRRCALRRRAIAQLPERVIPPALRSGVEQPRAGMAGG